MPKRLLTTFAAVILALSASAAAGAAPAVDTARVLTLSDAMPGFAGSTNTWEITGATPGATVVVLRSATTGSLELPPCPGVFLDLANPRLVTSVVADASGNGSFSIPIPAQAEGASMNFQAVERASCMVSNLVATTFGALPPTAVTVDVADNVFIDEDVTILTGGTVTWTWTGVAPHSTTGFAGEWDSGVKTAPTDDFVHSATFTEPGTYAYFCTVHLQIGMVGTVTVVDG